MHPSTPVSRLLCDLVAIPSVNPAFGVGQQEWTGEARVGDYMVDCARRAGLDVQRQTVAPGRDNILIGLQPTQSSGERVLLAPHLDTVRVIAPEQLDPQIRDQRLYGRGACDTKGSVAAMFDALRRLSESGRRPQRTEILLACLVDEENAQAGSRRFAPSVDGAALAIVGEPTSLRAVNAHKGALWMRMRTRGAAAHASQPHLGVSAVQSMARAVIHLEGDYRDGLKRHQHPQLGSPTVNVGVIRGGAQPNIVPESCEVLIDRRTLPEETDEHIMETIRSQLAQLGIEVEIENEKGLPSPAMETPPDHPALLNFLHAVQAGPPIGVDYFCDAAILNASNIPCVVYGPGDIAQAHTVDEWIALDQLESASERLLHFLQSLP